MSRSVRRGKLLTLTAIRRGKMLFAIALAAVSCAAYAALAVFPNTAQAATQGPCDIYAAGGTPCVAAHSTTRALYGGYNGPLYQVRRSSDGATQGIGVMSTGGYANAAAQDSFCAGTTCLITIIYDQSGHGNNLTQAPPGGFSGPASGGYDNLAVATAAPVMIHGSKAYGVYIAPGTGYRDNNTSGIATGDQPEGMYAILDGTHYNNQCCFDYGNAEVSSTDTGNGHMEAIYFGNATYWGYGPGPGPWVMADLENGLYSGVNAGYNAGDPTVNDRFLTAIVKGEPNHWAIRGGDAQSGGLSTFYDGTRPNVSGYNPMHKEGAIILGIGGDNSNGSAGTFYEGVMTAGYPSATTEDAVQNNITAAGYATASISSPFTPGTQVSLQATTACCTSDYIQHDASDNKVVIANVTASSSATDKADATWMVTAGLANSSCVSFESVNVPGSYLRHQNFELYLEANDGSSSFANDATFCTQPGNSGQGYSFESVNYPTKYIRHYAYTVYIASDGGSNTWDASSSWADDTSWLAAAPWSGGSYVRFENHTTGLFIDGMGRTSNGSNAGQWGNSTSYNQQWQIVSDGSYVRIENRATGLYLDGMGQTSNGSLVGQWSDSNNYNQQWLETTAGSYVRFQNRATGLYIDGMDWTANGSDLGQWGDSNSTNQQWQIVS